MKEAEIIKHLVRLGGFYGVPVPQFTFNNLRVDLALIDIQKRWVRGFEIKTTRSDFLRDEKWQRYTEFLSSLSIVCPENVIQPDEVDKPFGLLWVNEHGDLKWKNKPTRFQRRAGLAWLHMYVRVIEAEMPRLALENRQLQAAVNRAREVVG